jgi:hypothetical protein
MNKKAAIRAIKESTMVFVWVAMTDTDGEYFRAYKSSAIFTIRQGRDDACFDVVLRDNNDVYIN